MSIRSYEINLDSFSSLIPEPIVGRQGDKNGAVTLYVTVTDRGGAVDLTEQTINLMAKTAKGTAIIADNAGVTITDAVNGKFTYEIPNALWSEAGKIKDAYFSLNDTDGQQTTYDLIFIVKKAIDISQDKASDYITIVDGTLRDLKTKIDAIYEAYQTGAFYSRNEIDEFNADFETRISSNERYVGDAKKNSSDALATSLKIIARSDWEDSATSGWYPQGFSVNKATNELYLATQITAQTETRIEIHDLTTGELKSTKSFTNESNAFSEGIPFFYNDSGQLCFIVSVVNGNGYAIFNYDTETVGSNIDISGKFKWGVEGNNFVSTIATPGQLWKYSVYTWESIKNGAPVLVSDVPTEMMGNLHQKPQGITPADGKVYMSMGAYKTHISLQAYDIDGKIVTKIDYSKSGVAELINENYPGTISNTEDYLLESEGVYTVGHTLTIGVVADGKFYLMSVGEPDGKKVQTSFPTSNEKSYSQLLDDGYDILTLPSGDYEGANFKNTPLESGDGSLLKLHVEVNNSGRKVIRAVQIYSGNEWTRTISTDGKDGSGWLITSGATFKNTNLTTKNGVTATNVSYFRETRGYFAQKIELRIDKITNLPVNEYTIVATLPAEVAPPHQVQFVIPAYTDMNNHDKFASIWVTTGGDVYIATSTSATKSDIYSAVIDWVKW